MFLALICQIFSLGAFMNALLSRAYLRLTLGFFVKQINWNEKYTLTLKKMWLHHTGTMLFRQVPPKLT